MKNEEIDFDLTDLDACLFLFGAEGYAVWRAIVQPVIPRTSVVITGIDSDTNTITVSPA